MIKKEEQEQPMKAAIISYGYAIEISPTIQSICSYLSEHNWKIDIYVESLYRESGFKLLKTNIVNMNSFHEPKGNLKEEFTLFLKERLSGYDLIFAADFPALDILHNIGFNLSKVVFLSFEGIDYFLGYKRKYVSRLISGCALSTVQSRERGNTIKKYLRTEIDFEFLPVTFRPIKFPNENKNSSGLIRMIYSGFFAPWACLLQFLQSFEKSGAFNLYQLVLHGHAMGTNDYLQSVIKEANHIPNVQVDTSYYPEEQYHQMLASFNLGVAIYCNPSDSGNFENLIFSSGKIAAYLWNDLAVLTNIDADLTRQPPFIFLDGIDEGSMSRALELFHNQRDIYQETGVSLAREKYNFDLYMDQIYPRLEKIVKRNVSDD